MLKIYQHREKNNILYIEYLGIVEISDCQQLIFNLLKIYPLIQNKITILHDFSSVESLKDKEFINLIAKHSNENSYRFDRTILIGLKGILKVLYNVFASITTKHIKRVLIDKKEDAKKLYQISIPDDFILIFKNPEN